MTDAALEPRGNEGASHWARRAGLVTFCVLLLGTLGVVFTRVIAARVPEQRATLEKLITERTGLAVRFDNVHFAWNLDGTSAVFTRVELTDPKAGRVRVVAPELRVEFDTWDYLRNHQFSLGHVTLASPDIEIVGESAFESSVALRSGARTREVESERGEPYRNEREMIRRLTEWAALMPNGRIEVEGARVHLRRRGQHDAGTTFTLSQAVLSRGATTFNAFGTMLLSQDVGQSLFLSTDLDGLGQDSQVSGTVRVIARRVVLNKLPALGARGRGTLDATVRLQNGRIESANWLASARELELGDELTSQFDHFTVNGKLARDADDVLVELNDLQLTRGALLQRSPGIRARLSLVPESTRIARASGQAERLPLLVTQFAAALIAPRIDRARLDLPGGWNATAGELKSVHFASRADFSDWSLSGRLAGAAFERADRANISGLGAALELGANRASMRFDANTVSVNLAGAHEPRLVNLAGELAVLATGESSPTLRFDGFEVRSGTGAIVAQGEWSEPSQVMPLKLTLTNLDRSLLDAGWTLLAPQIEMPKRLAAIAQGNVVAGAVYLLPVRDADGFRTVNWQKSSGTLALAGLSISGGEMPKVSAGRGSLEFGRGATRLALDGGEIEALAITSARVDWPRTGAPRLRAALQGELGSPVVRRMLAGEGLEKLVGNVAIDAEARGEDELRNPDQWRVSARIRDASMPLGADMPPIEKLAGTVRYASGQLRALSLEGSWLGGPVRVDSRRANLGGGLSFGVNGVADTAPLLRLLGQRDVAQHVSGELAWTGTVQRADGRNGEPNGAWLVSLASNLAGVESDLPQAFSKARARQLPMNAQLRVDASGISGFLIDGREFAVRGEVSGSANDNAVVANFNVQGVSGELRRAAGDAAPRVRIDRLDFRRAPEVLAAAGALLPAGVEVSVAIDDVRYAGRSFGALETTLQRGAGVRFSMESADSAPHQIAARGACEDERCSLTFTADTQHLAALLRDTQLPAEWPTQSLHASGELAWPASADADLVHTLSGRFDLEVQGADSSHQLAANGTLADGKIELANIQGSGPAPDQLFRGKGTVGLVAQEYDFTVDYERVSMAATAVPTPARARLARMWASLRGSAARRGWAEAAPDARRVQWHGTWEAER